MRSLLGRPERLLYHQPVMADTITTTNGEAFEWRKGDTLMITGATRLDGTRDAHLDGWHRVRKVRGLWRYRWRTWWSTRIYRLRLAMYRALDRLAGEDP
jgi:hypothetical protein